VSALVDSDACPRPAAGVSLAGVLVRMLWCRWALAGFVYLFWWVSVGVLLAAGGAIIKRPSPLNLPKGTYDHSG
jgi:hypothetical protein